MILEEITTQTKRITLTLVNEIYRATLYDYNDDTHTFETRESVGSTTIGNAQEAYDYFTYSLR